MRDAPEPGHGRGDHATEPVPTTPTVVANSLNAVIARTPGPTPAAPRPRRPATTSATSTARPRHEHDHHHHDLVVVLRLRLRLDSDDSDSNSDSDDSSSGTSGDDRDCADFTSQADAQAALTSEPSDPDNLDADDDGIACEQHFGEEGQQVQVHPAGGVDTGGGPADA